ncbi:uncharacterized protein Dana_GF22416, isoform B [Drosophila ananassae]|uniref:histone acetyltransferase n=1 Tax=Drosophila ananassae TaxID=7217 RepID=A0A0P9BV83_DROAN|nr:histone acetyltransferase p300 isoform X2 [Drosophila ananassae]KPU75399.1 uncharacterized protein Dana_GF22416, isoform B [Drosophila ananassae]
MADQEPPQEQPIMDSSGERDGSRDVSEYRKRQLQLHLYLLFHAHKCKLRVCNVNYCKAMKAVLVHMGTCKQKMDCTMKPCASSRKILLHYKTCIKGDCFLCLPFRQNPVLQNARRLRRLPNRRHPAAAA